VQSKINIAAQVNGKLRAVLELPADADKAAIEQAAFADESVKKFIDGLALKKVIVVPGKLINIVVGSIFMLNRRNSSFRRRPESRVVFPTAGKTHDSGLRRNDGRLLSSRTCARSLLVAFTLFLLGA